MSHPQQQWVIVFLIYADFRTDGSFSMDNSTKAEINALLEDLLSCPMTARARLYVIMDNIRYVNAVEPEKFEIEERVLFYELSPSRDLPINSVRFESIAYKRTSLQRPTDLGHAFQQVARLTEILTTRIIPGAADEVLLVTWDHGSAFGIFREEKHGIRYPVPQTPIDYGLDKYPYLQYFWDIATVDKDFGPFLAKKGTQTPTIDIKVGLDLYSIVPDEEDFHGFSDKLNEGLASGEFIVEKNAKGKSVLKAIDSRGPEWFEDFLLPAPRAAEILKNRELAAVLHNWLAPQQKVGVLLMMNCWMMNLHTMYSLRKGVKYLVAPQGFVDSPGYNYFEILSCIYNSKPTSMKSEDLAVKCVEFSHDEALRQRELLINPKGKGHIDKRTIANVRLDWPPCEDKFEELIARVSVIIDDVIKMIDGAAKEDGVAMINLLNYVRRLSFDFTDPLAVFMIDLPNYLFNLANAHITDGPFTRPMIDEVFAFRERVFNTVPVIEPMFIGEHCYFTGDAPTLGRLTGADPTGYSIFFPMSRPIDANLLDNMRDDDLLKDLPNWKSLVEKIYGPIFNRS